jgi:hypothetical protein
MIGDIENAARIIADATVAQADGGFWREENGF